MENRYSTVSSAIDLRLSPSLPPPSVYLDAHRAWLEMVLGCELAHTVVLRLPVPYGDFILEDFLKAAPLAPSGEEAGAAADDDGDHLPPILLPFGLQAPVSFAGSAASAYVSDMRVWRSIIARWERAPGEPVELTALAEGSEGFSFAHLTAMHFVAAQAAFLRPEGQDRVQYADLESATRQVRLEMEEVKRAGRLNAGFGRDLAREGGRPPRR